jgi:hypothetical protein
LEIARDITLKGQTAITEASTSNLTITDATIIRTKARFLCRAKSPADSTRTIKPISRVIYIEIWRRIAARFESLPMSGTRREGWGDSGSGHYGYLRKKWPGEKNLLAMKIDPDIDDCGGASRGSISCNYEGVESTSFYPYFERIFFCALRGHDLPI